MVKTNNKDNKTVPSTGGGLWALFCGHMEYKRVSFPHKIQERESAA